MQNVLVRIGRPERSGVTPRADLVGLVTRFAARLSRSRVIVLPFVRELVGPWEETVLEDVVRGLISNALRYSLDQPDVLVTVQSRGHRAILRVADHGIGIPTAE